MCGKKINLLKILGQITFWFFEKIWSRKSRVHNLKEKQTSPLSLCSNLTSDYRKLSERHWLLAVGFDFYTGYTRTFLFHLCLMSTWAPERCKLFWHFAYNLCQSNKEQGVGTGAVHTSKFIAHSFLPCLPLTQGYTATRDNAPFGPFVVYEL